MSSLSDSGHILCIANKSLPNRVRVVCSDHGPDDYNQSFSEEHAATVSSRKLETPFYVVFAKLVSNADEKFEVLIDLLTNVFESDGAFLSATPNDIYPYFVLMDGECYTAKGFHPSAKPCRVLERDKEESKDKNQCGEKSD